MTVHVSYVSDCSMSTWVVLVMSCMSPVGIKSTTFGMLARMPLRSRPICDISELSLVEVKPSI